MKRCPQCNRVENDDTLAFCRVDGTALISDSGPVGTEAGTVKFGSAPGSSEIETSVLPHTSTTPEINRPTGPTTMLPAQPQPSTTRELTKPKRRKAVIVVTLLITAVVAVAIVIGGYFYSSRKSNTAIESIAVLPFENRSGSPDADYLSDGLADSLIYRLSQFPNLKVSPTSSVMRYKGKETDVAQIARELKVDAVMSGRLVQRGDDLSISVQLIDSRTEKLIWAEQYDRKMADLLATQREIATTITQKLQLKLSGEETGLAKEYTTNSEAYQLYLKGRFNWNKRTADGLQKATEYYNQAIEKDPGFALAYAGLADTYVLFGAYGSLRPAESMPRAKVAALKAIELDNSLAEPHATLGAYYGAFAWDFETAEREYRKATQLNPNYPTGWHWTGNFLPIVGKNDDAIAAAKRAEELDPLSAIISADTAFDLIMVRRYDEAVEQAKHTLLIDPNFYYAHYVMGAAYVMKGMPGEAVTASRKAVELNPDLITRSMLVRALAASAERVEARKLMDELVAESARRYIPGYYLAVAQAGLGDNDAAIASLARDIQERGIYMQWLAINPLFDSLRADPRFAELLKKRDSMKRD
jgi:TolB-like protein/Tfp pilus assembly protein PilF